MVAAVDMFGFQNVMKDYYGYKPGADDDAGRASKRAFQANMVQSAFDTQLAMQQAEQAQKYDLDTRMATADLELRNQKNLMKDTFDYGMQKMGAEFTYQSQFAGQQQGYDLEKMDKAAFQQRNQTRLEGGENRLTLGEQGRQERMNIGEQSVADIGKVKESGAQDRLTTQTAGEEQRKSISAQGDVDIGKIGEAGKQERLTLQETTRQTAKDRANQRGFATDLAAR